MQRLRFAFSAEGCEACREDAPQHCLLFSVEALVLALQSRVQEAVAETSDSRIATRVKILGKLSGKRGDCGVIIAKHGEGLDLQRNLGTLLPLRIKGVVLVAYCGFFNFRPNH